MFHYTGKIICDKCGIALITEAGSKEGLPSMQRMRKTAKSNGWYANKRECLCEMCYEKERGK